MLNDVTVKLYTTSYCPYCIAALELLDHLQVKYVNYDVTQNSALRKKISEEQNGYGTVPMIFVAEQFIGGYSDLKSLVDKGKFP